MGSNQETSRRRFLQLGALAAMPLETSGVMPKQGTVTQTGGEYRSVAYLVGDRNARPAPGSEFFDRKSHYGYLYQELGTGNVAYITEDTSGWSYLTQQPVTESYVGDGSATGREITLGFEPRWFEIHRDDSSNAEVYEGVGVSGDHSMRTVGGGLTTDIDRSTSVYATADGVVVGDGDASHGNTDGAEFVVVAVP